MLLSILIPTVGRKELKRCIEDQIASIEEAKLNEMEVEIIVGDNSFKKEIFAFLQEKTRQYNYIKHIKYDKFEPTAEDSLMKIIGLAKGDYVLSFGDDDTFLLSGIMRIIETIKKYKPDFLLLNSMLCNKNFTKPHIEVINKTDVIIWETGKGMFLDLGFWGMTTAFSLTCYKRELFSISLWKESMSVARIYSYSIALFVMFYTKKCTLITLPVVISGHNNPRKELKRIANYTITKENGLKFSAWSDGTLKLLQFASNKVNVSSDILFNSMNLVIDGNGAYHHSNMLLSTLNIIVKQLNYYKKKPFLILKDKNRLIQYLQTIRNSLPAIRSSLSENTLEYIELNIRLYDLKNSLEQNNFKLILEIIFEKAFKIGVKNVASLVQEFKREYNPTKSEIFFNLNSNPISLSYAILPEINFVIDREILNQLTVLIPTIGRIEDLKVSVNIFIKSVLKYNLENVVEILIVDNFSLDGTADYIQSLAIEHSFIKYFKHSQFRPSAEDSILYSAEQAKGKYIWTFGDDDIPEINAIPKILETLAKENPALLLLNLNFQGSNKCFKLLPLEENIIFEKGIRCFESNGLTGGLIACISAIVLKKEMYDISLFKEISQISPIYSHPSLMFCKVFDKKIEILAEPVFTYKANSEEAGLRSIGGLALKNKNLRLFAWHLGIIRLTAFISNYTNVSLSDIMKFQEYGHSKADGRYSKISLIEFILHAVKREIALKSDKKYFNENQENYNIFANEVLEFFKKCNYSEKDLRNELEKLL